jgi:dolichyl-phosphate-mannose-protein mannosyltransferase
MVPGTGVALPAAPRWAHAAAIAAVFVALAGWTWGGWPDVTMDFGRELYTAWRIAEGDVLYRDVMSVYGPLSPYVNAAWFRLFGASLRTLALCNLAILAAVTAVLWAIARRAGPGRLGATAGALAFLTLCGFAQMTSAASFNFVAPYSHDATHGFALAAAGVWASLRLVESGRVRWAAVAGACAGLCFLTKPESFLAGAGASALAVALALLPPGRRALRLRAPAAFVAALLVPPAAAFVLLATALPGAEAGAGVLGSWVYLANEQMTGLPFFTWSMGTNDVAGNLALLLRTAALQAAVLAPAAGLAWLARGRPRLAAALAAAAVLLALAPCWRSRAWLDVARPLPLWTVALLGLSGWTLFRGQRDHAAFDRDSARLVLAAFALLFLPRMLLNARLYHYGFVLAVPGVFLVVAALVDWIPRALDGRGASGAVFRAASLAALAVVLAFSLGQQRGWLRLKEFTLGERADRFRTDSRGAYLAAALQGIRGLARPGDTLVVLPEGVMINYLLRLRSSIPYLTMLPSEFAAFGEDELLGSLQREPPVLIALMHRGTAEYGPRFFGRDYGRRTAAWIVEHYEPAGRVGDPPLQPGSTFGIVALRRREPPAERP